VLLGTKYPNAGHIFATDINGQPTSFWRSSDTFRIAEGTNWCAIAFSDRKETVGYESVAFVARAGAEYVITRMKAKGEVSLPTTSQQLASNVWAVLDPGDRAVIHEIDAEGNRMLVTEGRREEIVFDSDIRDITRKKR
jgi:hypothetical protein